MAITSLDILNLSHSLKDIADVSCKAPDCLSQTLKVLLQYNLIQANLQYSGQFDRCQKDGEKAPERPAAEPPQEGCVGLDIANPNRLHGERR